jgi:hypothetical protein
MSQPSPEGSGLSEWGKRVASGEDAVDFARERARVAGMSEADLERAFDEDADLPGVDFSESSDEDIPGSRKRGREKGKDNGDAQEGLSDWGKSVAGGVDAADFDEERRKAGIGRRAPGKKVGGEQFRRLIAYSPERGLELLGPSIDTEKREYSIARKSYYNYLFGQKAPPDLLKKARDRYLSAGEALLHRVAELLAENKNPKIHAEQFLDAAIAAFTREEAENVARLGGSEEDIRLIAQDEGEPQAAVTTDEVPPGEKDEKVPVTPPAAASEPKRKTVKKDKAPATAKAETPKPEKAREPWKPATNEDIAALTRSEDFQPQTWKEFAAARTAYETALKSGTSGKALAGLRDAYFETRNSLLFGAIQASRFGTGVFENEEREPYRDSLAEFFFESEAKQFAADADFDPSSAMLREALVVKELGPRVVGSYEGEAAPALRRMLDSRIDGFAGALGDEMKGFRDARIDYFAARASKAAGHPLPFERQKGREYGAIRNRVATRILSLPAGEDSEWRDNALREMEDNDSALDNLLRAGALSKEKRKRAAPLADRIREGFGGTGIFARFAAAALERLTPGGRSSTTESSGGSSRAERAPQSWNSELKGREGAVAAFRTLLPKLPEAIRERFLRGMLPSLRESFRESEALARHLNFVVVEGGIARERGLPEGLRFQFKEGQGLTVGSKLIADADGHLVGGGYRGPFLDSR